MTKDETIDEALRIAGKVEEAVRGRDHQSVIIALGWVIGAGIYHPGADLACFDTAMEQVQQQARIKFKGMCDGTWR